MKNLTHLAVYGRNVGDNALNLAIDQMLCDKYKIHRMELLRNRFEKDAIATLNSRDAIVFGGGGLIHSYKPKGVWKRTGTMWDIQMSDLKRITKPIILFGVGFNGFEGEKPPSPLMREFFNILVSKGSLISFRNDGSRSRFLNYFPEFSENIEEIPDPGLFFTVTKQSVPSYIALQLAMDRRHYRYTKGVEDLVSFVKKLQSCIDMPMKIIPHTPDDRDWFPKLGIDAEIVGFHPEIENTESVIAHYANSAFSISTRGHSQICSIGNNVPTFAISTHPKVRGFMIENGLNQYCFDYLENKSHSHGIGLFERFLKELDSYRQKTEHIMEESNRKMVAFLERIDERLK